MVTALALAQQQSPYLNVSIVMPFYSYLKREYRSSIKTLAELAIQTKSRTGSVSIIPCRVSIFKWRYPVRDFLKPGAAPTFRDINIFLIGPGGKQPYSFAFKAQGPHEIYSWHPKLNYELRDLYFNKAVAELVSFLGEEDGHSIFETDEGRTGGVEVVHLHGATNAMVADYLRGFEKLRTSDATPPAIVYTLHDYLDEVEHTYKLSNAVAFLNEDSLEGHFSKDDPDHFYVQGDKIFTSSIGIDLADQVTFVANSVAEDMVEGRFDFNLKELVMPSIVQQAKRGAFVGISNGLDFTDQDRNPFVSKSLSSSGLAFPRVGSNVVEDHLQDRSFAQVKSGAKYTLVKALPELFSQEDLERPIILFIGRFQYNKGCEFFEHLIQVVRSDPKLDARFVAMGTQNNFPHKKLHSLHSKHPSHFTLIDDPAIQQEWGTLIRMASDLVFVPSFSESFGLIAAEGLLFGSAVISSAVGGLKEFLSEVEIGVDGHVRGNAFIFDISDSGSRTPESSTSSSSSSSNATVTFRSAQVARDGPQRRETLRLATEDMERAVKKAIGTWREIMDASGEEGFVRSLVADALALKWDREEGPVEAVSCISYAIDPIFSESMGRFRLANFGFPPGPRR